ncbi:MAG: LysR substrate-binding domain-containing protein [Mycolicibacterium insubricum]
MGPPGTVRTPGHRRGDRTRTCRPGSCDRTDGVAVVADEHPRRRHPRTARSALPGNLDFAVLDGPPADGDPAGRTLALQPWVLAGSAHSDLHPDRPMPFATVTKRPLALWTGAGGTPLGSALRQHTPAGIRIETDSVAVAKAVAAAGVADAVLPISACLTEIDHRQMHYAQISDVETATPLIVARGPAVQSQPQFAANFADIIAGQVTQLVRSGYWPADLGPSPEISE